MTSQLRHLPPVDTVLTHTDIAALVQSQSHAEVRDAVRMLLGDLRAAIRSGTAVTLPDFAGPAFAAAVERAVVLARQPNLRPVINATGIIVHTNLGRARLASEAIAALQTVAGTSSNLEYNLQTGTRGTRSDAVEGLICALTGAEAGLVVNNCAAAVMLSLMATAAQREVVVSRGELVEIGGSYRLPEVIAQTGAILKEVGATNKTRVGDYAQAIGENTAVLLKSHTSNYRIIGFTAAPSRAELAQLAQDHGLILMEDLGSGVLIDLSPFGLRDEPVVSDILASGVDLVMFSGDKLLGGPQAGIIAGRADLIARLKAHPMQRALRIDKLSLAALEATLRLYRAPHDPLQDIPVLRMLSEPLAAVQARADRLAGQLRVAGHADVEVAQVPGYVGGGSLPQQDLQSVAVSVASADFSADALAARLRDADTPVIGRRHQDRMYLDMRTVEDTELPLIVKALQGVLA